MSTQNDAPADCLIALAEKFKNVAALFAAAADKANEDPTLFENAVVKAAVAAEKATLAGRNLANTSLSITGNFQSLESSICEAHDVRISLDGNVMRIFLPVLLPHYKDSYKSIVSAPLSWALKSFANTHSIPSYTGVVLVFVNHVSHEIAVRCVRDNDNRDYKQCVNTVAFALLPDDCPKYCCMLNSSVFEDCDFTEIFVVPTDDFPSWICMNFNRVFPTISKS